MGSVTAQAVRGLIDLAAEAVKGKAVVVGFTFDGEVPDDYVLIGRRVRFVRSWGDLGNRQQKEVIQIQCSAACWGGDWNPMDRFTRANELVSLIDDAIRDQLDPLNPVTVFGIPATATPRAMITDGDTDTGDNEHGGTDSMIDFTVTVDAKIYRTQEGP